MDQKTHIPLREQRWFPALAAVLYLLIPAMQYLAVESSSNIFKDFGDMFAKLAAIPFTRHLTGWAVLLLLLQLLVLAFGRLRPALNVSAVLTTALAIGNLFVHRLHGTPFTFPLLKNTGTALNVISSYSITIGGRELLILGLFAAQLIVINLVFAKVKCRRLISLIPAAVLSLVMAAAYIGPFAWIPTNVISWSWDDAIKNYGYTNCLVQSTILGFHSTIKPENYDEKALKAEAQAYVPQQADGQRPDVIMILNETFYDLSQIAQIDPDTEYLEKIGALDNCLRGYSVIPGVGGGTNKAEYEFLTGNPLHLAPNVTPFNTFDLDGANSVVSYLESLGYETAASHPNVAHCYKRNEGYPGLGFDKWYFMPDFQNLEYYCGRWFSSDESAFENMLRWYEEMGDGPRFVYHLTIQNHGGYEQVAPENLLVHTQNDFGEHTHHVDEFLNCINFSDDAFVRLTEYFKDSDRDVIICMIGDHAPMFAPDITDESLTGMERNLRLRSTPYVIWSNHIDLDAEVPEYMSAVYMAPTVMKLAGLPLSGYYDTMLQLRDKVPVVSNFNYYFTADGKAFQYGEEGPLKDQVEQYLGFAYANINQKDFMVPFTSAAPEQ